MMFEMLKKVTLSRSQREKPPPRVTFLLSALSKAIASSVMYPFSLAKSRLQSGGETSKNEDEDSRWRGRHSVAKDNIFSMIVKIAQHEGWQSLYEGLGPEITKSFFSHGITMLVKQSIQRFLGKLWYISGIVFGRYRKSLSGKRMRQRARENVEYYNLGMARAAERIEQAVESALDSAKSTANATAEFVGEYVEEDSGEWRELYGTTGLAKWLSGDRTGPD
jgi:hypothetical protein